MTGGDDEKTGTLFENKQRISNNYFKEDDNLEIFVYLTDEELSNA